MPIQDTDLLIVNRGGNSYKAAISELSAAVTSNPLQTPIITSPSDGAGTNESFTARTSSVASVSITPGTSRIFGSPLSNPQNIFDGNESTVADINPNTTQGYLCCTFDPPLRFKETDTIEVLVANQTGYAQKVYLNDDSNITIASGGFGSMTPTWITVTVYKTVPISSIYTNTVNANENRIGFGGIRVNGAMITGSNNPDQSNITLEDGGVYNASTNKYTGLTIDEVFKNGTEVTGSSGTNVVVGDASSNSIVVTGNWSTGNEVATADPYTDTTPGPDADFLILRASVPQTNEDSDWSTAVWEVGTDGVNFPNTRSYNIIPGVEQSTPPGAFDLVNGQTYYARVKYNTSNGADVSSYSNVVKFKCEDGGAQAGAKGAWTLVSTIDADGATTVNFEGIDDTFQDYVIRGNFDSLQNGSAISVRFFDKSGNIVTTAGYSDSMIGSRSTTANTISGELGGVETTYASLGTLIGFQNGFGAFELQLIDPSKLQKNKLARYRAETMSGSSSSIGSGIGTIGLNSSGEEAITGVRFYNEAGGGTFTGTFKLYGIN